MERKWAIDLTGRQHITGVQKHKPAASSVIEVIPPLGYLDELAPSSDNTTTRQRRAEELKTKKLWEVAKSPSSTILMTAFMMYMTPSGLSIFTLLFIIYSLYNPISGIFRVKSAFARFTELKMSPAEMFLPYVVYIGLHLTSLGIVMYKCYTLGLFPAESDWASFLDVLEMRELSGGSVIGAPDTWSFTTWART